MIWVEVIPQNYQRVKMNVEIYVKMICFPIANWKITFLAKNSASNHIMYMQISNFYPLFKPPSQRRGKFQKTATNFIKKLDISSLAIVSVITVITKKLSWLCLSNCIADMPLNLLFWLRILQKWEKRLYIEYHS